jgi:hypothetical protein
MSGEVAADCGRVAGIASVLVVFSGGVMVDCGRMGGVVESRQLDYRRSSGGLVFIFGPMRRWRRRQTMAGSSLNRDRASSIVDHWSWQIVEERGAQYPYSWCL